MLTNLIKAVSPPTVVSVTEIKMFSSSNYTIHREVIGKTLSQRPMRLKIFLFAAYKITFSHVVPVIFFNAVPDLLNIFQYVCK